MRGEDQAGAQGNELITAQAAELHLLQYAKEFDLCKEAQVADFIEEEGAVRGLLKVAFCARRRVPR